VGNQWLGNQWLGKQQQNFELCIELIPQAIRVELLDLALSI
jgi:hypothetical protein